MRWLEIPTNARCELIEITRLVAGIVEETGLIEGAIVLQTMHTTSALTINENADPDVRRDLIAKLESFIPQYEPFYRHDEGNSDSHLKTSLFGPSLTVIVTGGKLLLGRWQGIYFCEWDGPRRRRVGAMILEGRSPRNGNP